jgi:cytochrome P450
MCGHQTRNHIYDCGKRDVGQQLPSATPPSVLRGEPIPELLTRFRLKLLQYDKNGLPCILPNLTGEGVLLPSSLVSWVGSKPETVLAVRSEHRDILEAEYTIPRSMLNDRVGAFEEAARKFLTRKLNAVLPEMLEELNTSLEQYWGTDTDNWSEINVFDTCEKIMAHAINRMLVGLPLCRNNEYLSVAQRFTNAIGLSALLIRTLPRFLKPILGPLIAFPCHYHYYCSLKFLKPLIDSRLVKKDKYKEAPNDLIEFMIENETSSNSTSKCNSETIRSRVLCLNFAGIHTSTFTMTNVLLSLNDAASVEKGYRAGIREEVIRVLAEEDGQWTKEGLTKMIRLDSAIRESMRIDTFSPRVSIRRVVAKEGITLGSGHHIREGNQIGLNSHGIHHDLDYYANPFEYDAFRFSRKREEFMSVSDSDKTSTDSFLASKNLSLVTTSSQFLGWGHGKFACPGRFFAATVMKTLLALVLVNYEIEPLIGARPQNISIGETVIAPRKVTLKVRRRTKATLPSEEVASSNPSDIG